MRYRRRLLVYGVTLLTIIAVITSIIAVISPTTASIADATCTEGDKFAKFQIVIQQCRVSQCDTQCTRGMCQLVEAIKSCPNSNGVNGVKISNVVGAYNQYCRSPLPLDKSNTCKLPYN
jgi:hypothetical protein